MRLCYVSKTCIGHFTQSDAIYHVPLSLARRWELTLLTGESSRPREVADCLDAELIVGPGAGWSRRALVRLEEHHARHPVDVVLTGIDEPSLLVGWSARRRLGVPWIAICEDHPFQARYENAGLSGRIERMVRTWLLRYLLRRPSRLLYFIHPDVLDFLWIKPSIKAPLNNSADLETIEPIRLEIEREQGGQARSETLIGYIGLVNRPKGGLRMLEVFRRVVAVMPEARFRLIGRLDEAFRPILDQFLNNHGLRDKVDVIGQVSSRDALMLAGQCTVCIHAYDPLPWLYWNQVLKILEYMALGVPVVSVDYPGTRSLIEHDRSGLLVPHEDPEAMALAVLKLLSDAGARARLRAGGLERARELSWKATEEKLYEIIERCVAESRHAKK